MLKRFMLRLSHHSGLNAVLRRSLGPRLVALCYHSVLPAREIGNGEIYRNTVSTEELREQLEILGRSFELVTGERVLAAAAGEELRRPSALITFDDGHHNLLAHAAPVLERLGAPAIMHVTTGHVGTHTPLWTEELTWLVTAWRGASVPVPGGGTRCPLPDAPGRRDALCRWIRAKCKQLPDEQRIAYLAELRAEGAAPAAAREQHAFRFLGWDDVRQLRRRGFVIGSHTVDHPILSQMQEATLDHQLRHSRSTLEAELGTPCHFIAYPNGNDGDVSPRVFARSKLAGYRIGFTTTGRFTVPARDPLAIGRVCIQGRLPSATFRAVTSGVHHWLRTSLGRN